MRILIIVTCIILLASAAVAAGDGALWYGLNGQLGGEFNGLLGPVGVQFASGSRERPSPDPDVSETPIKIAQTVGGAFYEWSLGNISVGAGVVSTKWVETGMKTKTVGGDDILVPIEIKNEGKLGAAAMLRVILSESPLFADGQVMVTSAGAIVTVRAGWSVDKFRVGVGCRTGPTSDWWSGPLLFVGATF